MVVRGATHPSFVDAAGTFCKFPKHVKLMAGAADSAGRNPYGVRFGLHDPEAGVMPTLIDKIWKRHVIRELSDGRTLLHIDRHLIHDGSSRQAFDGLRTMLRTVRNPALNFAVIDHIVSTLPGRTGESHPPGQERIHALREN